MNLETRKSRGLHGINAKHMLIDISRFISKISSRSPVPLYWQVCFAARDERLSVIDRAFYAGISCETPWQRIVS